MAVPSMKRVALSGLVLILLSSVAVAQAGPGPFVVRVTPKSRYFKIGHSIPVDVTITNEGNSPATLCKESGLAWDLDWDLPDGSGEGWHSYRGPSVTAGTDIDLQNGKITCVTSQYSESDFVSVLPGESIHLALELDVPEDIRPRKAGFQLSVVFKFSGDDIGKHAWTGSVDSPRLAVWLVK